ncbi:hypothetical protein MIND_00710300 [Mycena indigotica]|uniref:Uncharacterized protein n=1 Tax=Mycena indigotica TaxID=2126181 RepID=A0A8H6SP74_9AGAR|nr:uncharacterized protein MIND_00710300 [Mycena indigotica]KAF7301450.1 hypothetical protein MIND_00710300 [Mycena indigotica]
MATAAPPLPPAASRPRESWRAESSSSPFPARGRGGRGRGRGARGRGNNSNNANNISTRSDNSTKQDPPKQAPPSVQPPVPPSKPNPPPPPSSVSGSSETKEKSGRSKGRRPPRQTPAVVVEPAGPSAETANNSGSSNANPNSPRPSNRRRRSQQLTKANPNVANLKVDVPPLDNNSLRSPQGSHLAVPKSAPPPSKDTPPHLAGQFDMRSDINALVERVRAVAMENRPVTPGSASHIDWAGDDDESLPDLDDWGVKPSADIQKQQDELISPIIVDGLTPLPDPVVKPPTPPEEAKPETTPFASKETEKPVAVPLHPSLPPKPVSAVEAPTENTSPAAEPSSPQNPKVGLAASMHADQPASSSSKLSPHVPEFSPSHQRTQTVGRAFPHSAPGGFNNRFPRSGSSTPRGGYAPRNQHARTHSSPPISNAGNHRTPHSRPVITGDAISRLARTIAAPSPPRAQPISTTNN